MLPLHNTTKSFNTFAVNSFLWVEMGLMDIFKKKKQAGVGSMPNAPMMPGHGAFDMPDSQASKLDEPPMPSDSDFLNDMDKASQYPLPEIPPLKSANPKPEGRGNMASGMDMHNAYLEPHKDELEPYQLPKFSAGAAQAQPMKKPGAQPDFGDFDFSDSGQLDELEIVPDDDTSQKGQAAQVEQESHEDKELPPIEPISMDNFESKDDVTQFPQMPEMPRQAGPEQKPEPDTAEEDALPSDQYTTPGDLMESYESRDDGPKIKASRPEKSKPSYPEHETIHEHEMLQEPEVHTEPIIRKRIINDSMYVNVEVFREVAEYVNALENDSRVAEETLFRIKDIVLSKEKIYDKWRNDLEQVERELIQLDKILFNV